MPSGTMSGRATAFVLVWRIHNLLQNQLSSNKYCSWIQQRL